MARKKKALSVSNKALGGMIIAGLIMQYVLPVIRLGRFSWIGTVLYVLVALYLLFM